MQGVDEKDLKPFVFDGVTPVSWVLEVPTQYEYTVAVEWRVARQDERCRAGAGGRAGNPACSRPAVVTRDKAELSGRVVAWPYCGEHAGEVVPLADGRVARLVGMRRTGGAS